MFIIQRNRKLIILNHVFQFKSFNSKRVSQNHLAEIDKWIFVSGDFYRENSIYVANTASAANKLKVE